MNNGVDAWYIPVKKKTKKKHACIQSYRQSRKEKSRKITGELAARNLTEAFT